MIRKFFVPVVVGVVAAISLLYFIDRKFKPQINGVLRVHPSNPIYFTDSSGKAIYLGGHQIFWDLQDNMWGGSQTYNFNSALDWPAYVQFAKTRGLNYVRNWTQLVAGSRQGPAITTPLPYARVPGYGNANDGGPKFDLNRFNQEYFDRMRSRAVDLKNNGIYLSIMLFDVYSFCDMCGWPNNAFNSNNNINGIHTDTNSDGHGTEFFSPSPEVQAYQKAFVRKIIDTVGDLDNIIFEIANELEAPDWQYAMTHYIKNYEASRSKQHLVLTSSGGQTIDYKWRTMSQSTVITGSPGDLFSVSQNWRNYVSNPPVNDHRKPGIMDMDHILGASEGNNDRTIPWKAFTRGYHFSLYDNPFENPENESSVWDNTRQNIGAINNYANVKFSNLAAMNPSTSISSSGFALENPGIAYLVYEPNGGSFTVNLRPGRYKYEWFNPSAALVTDTGFVSASGGDRSFTPPFSGDAVLYLIRQERMGWWFNSTSHKYK
jgi:hypothetical protein